ncbi:hypothetical protein ACHAXT_001083 [Thalassiosira profunda]
MSAYASLPGSFMPPFFAFGGPAGPGDDGGDATASEGSKDATADTSSVQPNTAQPQESAVESALQSLDITCKSDGGLDAPTPSLTPSRPKDIIIAFRSARVDPRALLKSLTSTGGNIARRTASFITSSASESPSKRECAEESKMSTSDDAASTFSGPGLCYEDTDSDEEYSMYDYSDDFSSPHDEPDHDDAPSGREEDPSAIEFELSITYQGRKYNATRAFPTFVQLRNDLLKELNGNDEGDTKQTSRFNRGKRCAGGARSTCSDSTLNESEDKDGAPSSDRTDATSERVSVPELPRVSPENLGHAGFALSGVARSGFALLQATAQHYCPEMESWMSSVVAAFPCSQVLSSFLWEPLSSSNEGWATIGEGKAQESDTDGGISDATSSLTDKASFAKPPLHHGRSKPKPSMPRYKSKGSLGSRSTNSLCSIDEGVDCDEHSL